MAHTRPFRIVSIEHPADVHVRDGQLVVSQDKGVVTIPVRDILVLAVCGPNIRMSTMAQTMLAERKVAILFLGRNHHPAAMLLPTTGCVRHARIARVQASLQPDLRSKLWRAIVIRKIRNQARALDIMGCEGADRVRCLSHSVLPDDADNHEGQAARLYFQLLQPGFKRRVDDPMNSALNYGYAIARALVAREIVCVGFVPSIGLHHRSQLNAFNLADDLMEPFRPSIDLLAAQVAGNSSRLSPKQRTLLRQAGRLAVLMSDAHVDMASAMRTMAHSLVRCIEENDASLLTLPKTQSVKLLNLIEE